MELMELINMMEYDGIDGISNINFTFTSSLWP